MIIDRKPTIYVAGPMRGLPDYNFPQFDAAAQALKDEGWSVINPADTDRNEGGTDTCPHEFDPNTSYEDREFMRVAMARDISAICNRCTAIYMLKGWERSSGAKAEHAVAQAIGIETRYETVGQIVCNK